MIAGRRYGIRSGQTIVQRLQHVVEKEQLGITFYLLGINNCTSSDLGIISLFEV